MICIGDRVTERPFESSKRMSGRVIYVHPSQRWYTVEFEVGFKGKIGKYREAFFSTQQGMMIQAAFVLIGFLFFNLCGIYYTQNSKDMQ